MNDAEMTSGHLAAQQTGKAIALNVINEYLTVAVLEQPKHGN